MLRPRPIVRAPAGRASLFRFLRKPGLVLGLVFAGWLGAQPLQPNMSLPIFQLPLLDGGELGPAQLEGRVVLIDFWASWCPPCRHSLPAMRELQQIFRGSDVVILPVSVDEDPASARRFRDRFAPGMSGALDRDSAVVEKFRPRILPSAYLVDPAGTIRYLHTGFRKGDEHALEREIRNLLDAAGPERRLQP